jgi:uncharacterized protein YjiS (DUF1127 family)
MAHLTINPPAFGSLPVTLRNVFSWLRATVAHTARHLRPISDLGDLSDRQLADVGWQRLGRDERLKDRYIQL